MEAHLEHVPVLLQETLEALAIRSDGIYLDGTFGRGGHARAILERLGEGGHLLATDKDPTAVGKGRQLFGAEPRFELEQGSFTMLETLADKRGWIGRVNGILLDLGVSSPQLDDPARGFSFRGEGPLDMRMDHQRGMSAADWLAEADDRSIARVLREYGEERFAGRIARAIVRARETEGPIRTTGRLAEVVARANPSREKGKDPATRTFQAIRIFINDELVDLDRCLEAVPRMLAPGGRLAVISFHSLEDRRVKQFIRREARGDEYPPDLPIPADRLNPRMRPVGKAVRPGSAEIQINPRARSAVLRVAERV